MTSHRARRALIIGALGVTLAAGGGAAVWAASTPSPSPSSPSAPQSTPSKAPTRHGAGIEGHGGLHGEVTVKRSDGSYVTLVSQRGTVTEVTDSKLTVKSEDGYTHSYVLNSSTKIRSASDPKGAALKASDLKAGDEVAVRAQRSGSDDTATAVAKGPFPVKPYQGQGAKGKGHERMHGSQDGNGTHSPAPSPSASLSVSHS